MAVISYAYNDKTQLSKHFNVQEFRCKCGKTHDILISQELVYQLERLFSTLDCSKIIVSSGHRCSEYDKKIGNSGVGQHILGKAADVYCYDQNNKAISTKIVSCVAQDLGFGGIANINSAYTWIHLDVRTSNIYMGNEIINYHTLTNDFYKYYGLTKEEVYGEKYKPSTTTSEITKGDHNMSIKLKGVDLSKHDGTVDFATLSKNVDFAIIRAGYGKLASQKDVKFEEFYAGCKKYGIPVGTYWYSYAKSVSEMKQEAQVFLSVIKGKQFEYPVYLDFEEKSQFNLGKATCIAMAKAFLEVIENAGYYAGMYCSSYYLSTFFDSSIRDKYTIWLAHYNVTKPTYSGAYDIWQYTSKGRIGGVNGNVDMNWCYTDFPSKIKAAGLNGFPKSGTDTPASASQPTPKKSNEEIAKEVLAGKWGNGDERKRRLTEVGYNYADVQKAVNALLNQNDNTTIEPVAQKTDEKKQIKVTIDFDDHQYSGLLEEM